MSNNRSQRLRSEDAATVQDLVMDLHDLTVPALERKAHLLRRLAEMVHARVGLLIEVDGLPRGPAMRVLSIAERGWEPAEQQMFHEVIDREGIQDPLSLRALALPELCLTIRRQDLMSDRAWYATTYASELRRAANIDDIVGTIVRLPEFSITVGLSMHRSWGERKFSARDRAILDLLGRALQRMYPTALNRAVDRARDALSPRLARTLELLLQGRGEKQIAGLMHRSPHTVHEHVKELYRRFGVCSRAELLAACLRVKNDRIVEPSPAPMNPPSI